MATITPMPLVQNTFLPNAAPVSPGQYVVGAGKSATIRHIRAVNTDSADRIVTVQIVTSGGAPGAQYRVIGPITLKPAGQNESVLVDDSIYELLAGDFISGDADVADKVTFRVDGFEVSP